VALICAALFAALAGRRLTEAASLLTNDPGYTILAAVFVWVGGPIVAGLAFATVIGLPLGFGILLFALPALMFLGYIVAATRLGMAIVGRGGADNARPFGAALLGVLIMQVLMLIPVLGFILALLAGLYGSGALALLMWRGIRGSGTTPTATTPPAPAPAAQ
jgi:hypothetical protein